MSVESLAEVGVHIAGERSRALTPDMVAAADVVVTIGREATVEPSAGKRIENWDTDEPSERGIDGIARMRLVRDDISAKVTPVASELSGR